MAGLEQIAWSGQAAGLYHLPCRPSPQYPEESRLPQVSAWARRRVSGAALRGRTGSHARSPRLGRDKAVYLHWPAAIRVHSVRPANAVCEPSVRRVPDVEASSHFGALLLPIARPAQAVRPSANCCAPAADLADSHWPWSFVDCLGRGTGTQCAGGLSRRSRPSVAQAGDGQQVSPDPSSNGLPSRLGIQRSSPGFLPVTATSRQGVKVSRHMPSPPVSRAPSS